MGERAKRKKKKNESEIKRQVNQTIEEATKDNATKRQMRNSVGLRIFSDINKKKGKEYLKLGISV